MTDKSLPSPEILNKLLRYDAETGRLFWKWRDASFFDGDKIKAKSWNNRFSGKEALTALEVYGYRHGHVCGMKLKAHRVVWAMVHGAWPDGCIDHINGDPSDNRISNLRSVTHAENSRNRALSKNNTSGIVGVYWRGDRNVWKACIEIDGTQIHLGNFLEKSDAISARRKAERDAGFHPNHGRPR